jgi:NAD-dependent DNA ligase
MGFNVVRSNQVVKKRVDPPPPSSVVKKPEVKHSGWGTPEEKHRWLCLLAQLCRYAYYCHDTSIVSDKTYDDLEDLIRGIEKRNPDMERRYSPITRPGSDKESSYPQSILNVWAAHKDDNVWSTYDAMIQRSIQEAQSNKF